MANEHWNNGTRVLMALAFLIGAAACGDDDGFAEEGVYELTRHTYNDQGCAAEGEAVDDFTHFQLAEEALFGQTYLAFGECASADPSSCESRGIFGAFVVEGGELVRRASSSSGGGDFSCFLGFQRATITTEGDTLTIEWFTYGEEDDTLSEDECDPDVADERGTDMACETYEVMAGIPVP